MALLDDLVAECLLLLGALRLGADCTAAGLRLGDLFFGDERLWRRVAVDQVLNSAINRKCTCSGMVPVRRPLTYAVDTCTKTGFLRPSRASRKSS